MSSGGISIWFFIGIALVVDGALILGAGVWQWLRPPVIRQVLWELHAGVWWGGLLLGTGIAYAVRYAPRNKDDDRLG